jgi:hypothetical protein
MQRNARLCLFLLLAGIVTAGCASGGRSEQAQIEAKQREIEAKQRQLAERERALDQRESEISRARERLETPDVAAAPPSMVGTQADLLPPQASPGECFARAFVPASYAVETETVLKQEASEQIEVIPARYEWVEERVLVREASQGIEVVPATYEWVERSVLERPAHTVWKKGRGPIERIDEATGEIMCLVEVPAQYKTVRKRVLKTPATTRTVEIPAEYKTVRVWKMVEPAQTRRIPLPAQYETITRRKLIRDGRMEWRPILCETNVTRGLVTSLQRALAQEGYDPGPIDGYLGRQTLRAVKSYQEAKGLPTGELTIATLDALGLKSTPR